jgi:hypothetical protein
MPSIKGYQYITEQEAINARELCDTYFGIPVTPDDITQNWVDYQFAELNDPKFWYITYDDSLLPVLGQPTDFDVTYPPFPAIA